MWNDGDPRFFPPRILIGIIPNLKVKGKKNSPFSRGFPAAKVLLEGFFLFPGFSRIFQAPSPSLVVGMNRDPGNLRTSIKTGKHKEMDLGFAALGENKECRESLKEIPGNPEGDSWKAWK